MNHEDKECTLMRHQIMIAIRANGVPVTGDMWFSLVFKSKNQLKAMCNELHIITKGI
ncbi:MAG: hypothetical protein M0P12_00165 [Paludibacteraceae bacterium]|jgi:hypothetical protein|nr:hypothetical protein [Paludibacteraceae bacterium]